MELIIVLLLVFFFISVIGSLYEVVVFTEKNDTRHPLILEFSKDPKLILFLFQILITASNLGIGAASELLVSHAPTWFKTSFYVFITAFMITFAEIIPKQLGFFYSKFFLDNGGHIILMIYRTLKPIIYGFSLVLNFLNKLMKIDNRNTMPIAELEELRGEIEELMSGKPRTFTKKALAILQSLSTARVSDVLIPRTKIKLCEFNNLGEAKFFAKHSLVDIKRCLIKVKNKYYSVEERYDELNGKQVSLIETITCSSLSPALEVLVELNNSKSKLAVCFDEFGLLDGIFDPTTIVDAMYSWSQAIKLSEDKIIVNGSTRLSFICLFFEKQRISDFDLNRTVDSILLEIFGIPLRFGAKVKIEDLQFKILKSSTRSVDLVEIQRITSKQTD